VPGDFEQVCTFAWVREEYPPQKISGVRCDIFRECKRSRGNVFVQEIDVVSFRVRWIVIERQITC
jgi:hypothetical protein